MSGKNKSEKLLFWGISLNFYIFVLMNGDIKYKEI